MCEFFKTCSRRGTFAGCEKGEYASWRRCRRAAQKAGAFPKDEHAFRPIYETLRKNQGDQEPVLDESFSLPLIFKPVRNIKDGSLAGYQVIYENGDEVFLNNED
jgi:hypothetical protein